MRILYTYTNERLEDQVKPLRQIVRIAQEWGNNLELVECVKDDDYYHALLEDWGECTLVNIEQDIVAYPFMIDRMHICPEQLCVYPYLLRGDRWSVYNIEQDVAELPLTPCKWYEKWETVPSWADGSGIGFIKISEEAQQMVDLSEYPVSEYHWWYLDTWLSYRFHKAGLRFHVHDQAVEHIIS